MTDKREPPGDGPGPIKGRLFKTGVATTMLSPLQTGVLRTRYRNRAFVKSPFDVVIYMQLLERLRPATVIEIGSWQGGSAVWFADVLTAMGVHPRVVSVDIQPPTGISDPRIQFVAGNALDLGAALAPELLASLPRPWLVSEDSAHTMESSLAVLRFFDQHLRAGEYIVVEDGVLSDLPEPVYRQYGHGPNRAVFQFLLERGQAYEIDASLCDLYGSNVTYNPNGWLRRVL